MLWLRSGGKQSQARLKIVAIANCALRAFRETGAAGGEGERSRKCVFRHRAPQKANPAAAGLADP